VLTRFIYSLAIGISLLLIPQVAYADEVLIELTSEVTYVDTVVEVNGPTEYSIETFTGVRMEQAANGTVTQRVGWVDSWIQLRQGDTVLRADDDSNHVNGVNEYASKITGTVDTGTYTIRATSYLNAIGYGNPTGTYTLSSNLIQPVAPIVPVVPVVVPPVVEPLLPEPVSPPIIPFEPPIVIDTIAPEPPTPVEEPPVVIEEPPVPAEEPPTEPEIAPVEEELPPTEIDTPPVEEEAPPAEAEEPPTPVEEAPPTVEEAVADVIAEAEANGEIITADTLEEAGLTLADLPSETPVQLDNGVVLEAGTVVALQLLENPVELLTEIFNDPGQVLTALSNIGADMSDEERTTSENTIIASVIAGQAAINAVGAATMTRAATPTSTPTGGGAPSANDNIKLYKRRKP
jgi:hypothetical protein